MNNILNIPLQVGTPQTLTVAIAGVTYTFSLIFRNDPAGLGGWVLDIGDVSNNPIVQGVPLVTGTGLLEQFDYLGLNFDLRVQTTDNPDAVPTFANLGSDALLYSVTN